MSLDLPAALALPEWPAPIGVQSKGFRHYPIPGLGKLVTVTTVEKVLGLGVEGLISWSAKEERKACLEACAEAFAADLVEGPQQFADAVEARLGAARSHQKILTKAAEIGTETHSRINWQMRTELGEDPGPAPFMSDAATWAWMAFDTFWRESGLRVVRTEQTVWHPTLRYAGSVDIIAEDVKGIFGGGLGILDLKTSRGVYEAHHVQIASYREAASHWAPMRWGAIARLPKVATDPNFELVMQGDLYGGRKVTQEQLFDVFKACLTIWNTLCRPEGA